MTTLLQTPQDVLYPEDDGLPLSENTQQLRLILTTLGGLQALFRDDEVFVAGDLVWYPVKGSGENKAPDVMVVFGQDKRDRRSYLQWEEGNLGPQVTFEFVSNSNSEHEVEVVKRDFYQKHGVEEYYVHDPDRGTLLGWLREGDRLQSIESMNGWVSPHLGIRFELVGRDLQLYHPNGKPFITYSELMQQQEQTELRAEQAESQQTQTQLQLEQSELQRQQAELRAEQAERQLSQLNQLAERFSALSPEQLNALGIDPGLLE